MTHSLRVTHVRSWLRLGSNDTEADVPTKPMHTSCTSSADTYVTRKLLDKLLASM